MKPAVPAAALALVLTAALALFPARPAGAAAGADANAGKRVYAQCIACHKLDASGTSGVGPNLKRVLGRRVGSLPGFRFSPAMAASTQVWTERSLDAYLAAPARAIPGSRMPFAGLRNPADRRNVIAYIKSVSK